MIGRAAFGRPWLPGQILSFLNGGKVLPPPSVERQRQIVLEHFEDVLSFYGEAAGLKIFRRHLCWYSRGFRGSAEFRKTVTRAEDVVFVKNCVGDFYAGRFRTIL
jgi:tRNA-dihydrouridine synthase B